MAVVSPMRSLIGVVVAVVVGVATATPAGAVETAEFGLEPVAGADGEQRPAFRTHVSPGATVSERFVVWNKTPEVLSVRLEPVTAEVDADGQPHLGGDPAVLEWVDLEEREVRLAPGASQQLSFTVTPPDDFAEDASFAILAEPVREASGGSQVISRVAVLAYVTPAAAVAGVTEHAAPGGGGGGPAILPLVGAALVLAAAGGLVAAGRTRTRQSGAAAPPGRPRRRTIAPSTTP